jgi:uncharacterized protein YqfB (UPF0267 family)
MAGDKQGSIHSASEGGVVGKHADPDPFEFLVGPSTSDESNTARLRLIPVGCFRVDDLRFKFDSSFVLPETQADISEFANLRKNDPKLSGAPISIFGHADPSFQGNFEVGSQTAQSGDDYNKNLSGRRAIAIYAMLIRDPSFWDTLYTNHLGTDVWGQDSIRTMLNSTGQQAPPDDNTVVNISNDSGKRKQLFLEYMNFLCGDLKFDKSADFLAKGAGSDLKGDVQGCSRFNPLLLFSAEDEARFQQAFANKDEATLRGERDLRNSVNRRVMILVFRKGSQILPSKWPCPTYKQGPTVCKTRFFSGDKNGDTRRSTHYSGRDHTFDEDKDTFACRFYQRISDGSPCHDIVPSVQDPCRIVMVHGGKLKIAASEIMGVLAESYSWTTSSTKIKLTNADTPTVTVEGLATPSASRGAETLTLSCGAAGVRTVNITVAKVTFSASSQQRYGYDNFDTPANPLDDHVCIKNSDYTFLKVDIQGGALGTDFDFVCDDPSICAPVAPGATASFDLRLNAGATNKGHTTLRVKLKCPDNASEFTHIEVHVYKERDVDVVVAKIDNPNHTYLRFPTADYAAHGPTANAKLKEAVVKYNITNFSPTNAITPITFVSGTGVLSYDIGQGGGADLNAISAAMTGTGTKVRVAIIRDMKSYYYLQSAVAAGATTVVLTAAAGSVYYHPGDSVLLGTGATQETVSITAVAGSTITCAALTNAHAAGEAMEFPAAGWGSDPILIMEGNASLNVAKWTVLHEVGHRDRGLQLSDIIDVTDFMNWQQSWTDYRLRYCPRLKNYPAGTTDTENQWELIPRT